MDNVYSKLERSVLGTMLRHAALQIVDALPKNWSKLYLFYFVIGEGAELIACLEGEHGGQVFLEPCAELDAVSSGFDEICAAARAAGDSWRRMNVTMNRNGRIGVSFSEEGARSAQEALQQLLR